MIDFLMPDLSFTAHPAFLLIQQELLADQPPYNFENEDEQRACELAGKER